MSQEVLVAQHLGKQYRMGKITVTALKDVNVTINKGDYIAIVGPSGSGKSTFMNLLGCLDKPTSGKLFLEQIDVTTLPEMKLARIRREKIGFIFQKYNLIPTLNAVENVCLPMGFAGMTSQKRVERAKYLLDLVDLSQRFTHKPSELSGGEQQRVAIARALSNSPSIILADEPTGNVDSKSGSKILSILENINQKGETLIVVTHDLSIARRARRILQINDGEVRESPCFETISSSQ
jgi:putative ABC transport system ATP-binding protein